MQEWETLVPHAKGGARACLKSLDLLQKQDGGNMGANASRRPSRGRQEHHTWLLSPAGGAGNWAAMVGKRVAGPRKLGTEFPCDPAPLLRGLDPENGN